jgi:hypothetical protein
MMGPSARHRDRALPDAIPDQIPVETRVTVSVELRAYGSRREGAR